MDSNAAAPSAWNKLSYYFWLSARQDFLHFDLESSLNTETPVAFSGSTCNFWVIDALSPQEMLESQWLIGIGSKLGLGNCAPYLFAKKEHLETG